MTFYARIQLTPFLLINNLDVVNQEKAHFKVGFYFGLTGDPELSPGDGEQAILLRPPTPARRAAAAAGEGVFAGFGRGLVELDPFAAMGVIICQEVGGVDGLHLLSRAGFGGAEAEQLAEGLVVHVVGQDQPGGGDLGLFRLDLGLFHR